MKTYRLVLTEEEHRLLKVEAAKAGKTIKELILDAVKQQAAFGFPLK